MLIILFIGFVFFVFVEEFRLVLGVYVGMVFSRVSDIFLFWVEISFFMIGEYGFSNVNRNCREIFYLWR